MLSFFPRDFSDDILDLIESVSEGFPTYFDMRFHAANTATCTLLHGSSMRGLPPKRANGVDVLFCTAALCAGFLQKELTE